jgi:hypothetical protein
VKNALLRVAPHQVVVIELLFEPLREAAFAGRHARGARADGGYQDCQLFVSPGAA